MATREEQRREHNEQKELESLRRVFDSHFLVGQTKEALTDGWVTISPEIRQDLEQRIEGIRMSTHAHVFHNAGTEFDEDDELRVAEENQEGNAVAEDDSAARKKAEDVCAGAASSGWSATRRTPHRLQLPRGDPLAQLPAHG